MNRSLLPLLLPVTTWSTSSGQHSAHAPPRPPLPQLCCLHLPLPGPKWAPGLLPRRLALQEAQKWEEQQPHRRWLLFVRALAYPHTGQVERFTRAWPRACWPWARAKPASCEGGVRADP